MRTLLQSDLAQPPGSLRPGGGERLDAGQQRHGDVFERVAYGVDAMPPVVIAEDRPHPERGGKRRANLPAQTSGGNGPAAPEGASRPWQHLNFLPLPQGQGRLRPIFVIVDGLSPPQDSGKSPRPRRSLADSRRPHVLLLSSRNGREGNPPRLARLLVRLDHDLNVAVEAGQKFH